ncbi:MAG: asparagine synthase (glutamine-hydrolyzing) [Proteobacteria bacterium]|nr:asparagine synthase (glutamine-hydrolyzing) [Pseudomonadota bacterium]
MCGIMGAFAIAGEPPVEPEMRRLLPLLRHRGPDGSGVARAGAACFGHTRLSILGTDLPVAGQPVDQDDALLTFNGEIYNFTEIVDRLRQDGVPCGGGSDTEALFLALRHWGIERTLQRIDGMFAFAYFDAATGQLYLARDPLGEKPLYWAQAGGRLWFASEIKVLLASGAVSPEPNLKRVDDYLYTSKVNGVATMFRHVLELEAGTLLIMKRGASTPVIESYWRLEDTLDVPPGSCTPEQIKAFGGQLERAVASRRVSDLPVGVLLSGGIDSNSLAECLISSQPDSPLPMYFADNANSQVSEATDVDAFIDMATRRHPEANLQVNRRLLSFDNYFEELSRITWHYDEPVQFANSPLLGGLCAAARDDGLKVLLSGEGADEILYGYDRFARTSALLEAEPDRQERLRNLYFGGGMDNADVVRRLTASCAEGAAATEPWQWLERNMDHWSLDTLQMLFSQRYRLQTLLQRQDRVGMSRSIELRVPFLAPWFVSWVNGLPLACKYNADSGQTKYVLRQAMAKRLPERILTKPKDGFPTDMTVWLRERQLAGMAEDLICAQDSFSQTYLDGAYAKTIVKEHFQGEVHRDMLIWLMLSLEIWHRTFRHGVNPDLHCS